MLTITRHKPIVGSGRFHLLLFALILAALSLCSCSQATPTPAEQGGIITPSVTSMVAEEDETTQMGSPTVESATIPSPTTAALPRFEPAECRFRPPALETVVCGDLLVPENRSVSNSATIRLHVAVLKSNGEQPEPDPLIYLSGGPGSVALEWLYWDAVQYGYILKHRDVIFFDQRGIGYSEPSLDCPEVSEAFHDTLDQNMSTEEWIQSKVGALLACHERLIDEGIDLSAYNSATIAADVNDLRLALGYDKVNLFGLSYGTRLALTIMREFPEAVRSVVLDSPVPLQMDIFSTQGQSARDALNLVFERCAAEEACNAAFPGLRSAFYGLLERLEVDPITVHVSHLFTRQLSEMTVNGNVFLAGVIDALYDPDTILELPKIIYNTYHQLPGHNYQLAQFMQIYLIRPEYSSEGMRYSVLCSEEAAFTSFSTAMARGDGLEPRLRDYLEQDLQTDFSTCDAWGVESVDPIENVAVKSEIPTLVMTGEFDPVTPPAWGEAVIETLPNATHVVFPNLSHGVFFDRSCPGEIVAAFLDDPYADPDLHCVEESLLYPSVFVTR